MNFTLTNGARKTIGRVFWPKNVLDSLRNECYLSGISVLDDYCDTSLQLMALLTSFCPNHIYFGTLSVQGSVEYGYWLIDPDYTDMANLHTSY